MRTQEFTIKDLESFSGIKAHTIRIWEQRYGLLNPERTDTNIRKYTDKDLKALLNIGLLNNLGYKISKIAQMSETQILDVIRKQAESGQQNEQQLHLLKIAMLNYDEALFSSVLDPQIQQLGLEQAYRQVVVPFLNHIGLLWQSDAICPAQEHFISALIRQKVLAHTETIGNLVEQKQTRPVVLFLPELEIHELSLLVLHYIFKKKGYKSIFLGQSVPLEDLKQVMSRLGDVDFVSILTTSPSSVLLPDYLKKAARLVEETDSHFHLTGSNLKGLKSPNPISITFYSNISDLESAF